MSDLPPLPPLPQNPTDAPDITEARQQDDYFGFQETHEFLFPDGITYIVFEKMNEGKKSKFQKNTSRDLVLERTSGNARVRQDAAADRHALIKACATGWNLKRRGEPLAFTDRNLTDLLDLANPQLIEDLEKAIRKANPWLMAEMSVADIEREMTSLEEMLEIAKEREAGNSSSSSK